jgi:hypothetical protein
MVAIIISSSVLLYTFFGFGIFFKKLTGLPLNLTDLLLIGLVMTNSFATLASLFFPTSPFTLFVFLLVSTIFMLYLKEDVKKLYLLICSNGLLNVFIFLFAVVALIKSVDYPNNYDSALYHLQAIKWIEKFPALPGLANLHGRLGFDSNVFSLFALASLRFIFKQEVFSVNFTAFVIVIIYLVKTLYRLSASNKISNLLIFNIVIFYLVLGLDNLSSPVPEYVSTIIILYIFLRVINFSFEYGEFEFIKVLPLFLIAVYAVTVKLAALPIMILFVLLPLIDGKKKWSQLLKVLPLSLIIIIPWCVRNIVLTGWLIYPFPHFDIFNVDWKVPLSNVITEKEAITGWARSPDVHYRQAVTMNISEWFPIWWRLLNQNSKIWIFFAATVPLLGFVGLLLKKINISRLNFIILITAFLGVIYWFVLAPDYRFGMPFILISAWSFLLYTDFRLRIKPLKITDYAYVLSLLIVFACSNTSFFNKMVINEKLHTNVLIMAPKMKVPNGVYFKLLPVQNGKIFVPSQGDQCFDCEIPCATHYDQNIIFRGSKIDFGFKYNASSIQ